MGVEVYQGTIAIGNSDTYQKAVKEIFSMAGYSVTPDATSHKVTVDAGGNVFGHKTFNLGNLYIASVSNTNQLVMLVDKDQHVMIVSTAKEIPNTYNVSQSVDYQSSVKSIACLLVGDIDRGDISDNGAYTQGFNFPNLDFSRVDGQPCIVTPCIDKYRENLAPIFVAANGVVYPLGTYVTDGSTKFVSNGNGLLIKVKEQ